jgi:sortase A
MTVKVQCRLRSILGPVSAVLFAVGLLLLGCCAVVFFEATIYQAEESSSLEQALPHSTPSVPRAAMPCRLEVPRLGLSVMVRDGVDSHSLRMGAGHIPGTALPGEAGNIGIAAHRDMFFRSLRSVQPRDTILLTTLDGTYRYSVEWIRVVKPRERDVLGASPDSVLTLVTCYPFYYIGSAPERFIVRARLDGFSR